MKKIILSLFIFLNLTASEIALAKKHKVKKNTPEQTASPAPKLDWDFRSAKKLNILVFGDWGKGTEGQKKVAAAMIDVCKKNHCDFALSLGDNFYEDGVQSTQDPKWKTLFEDIYKDLDFTFFAVLGNHDHRGNIHAQIEYSKLQKRWKMPASFYKIENLPSWLHIWGLDSEKWTPIQSAWAKYQLCLPKGKGWNIAMAHHPIFSNGAHGDTELLKKELLPTLKKCNTQVYLAGHDHDQQHFKYLSHEFIVQGAGAETRPIEKKTRSENAKSLFGSEKTGFTILELTEKKLKASFYDSDSKVLYSFSRNR